MKLPGLNLAKTSALHLAEDRTRFASILWRVIDRFGGGKNKGKQGMRKTGQKVRVRRKKDQERKYLRGNILYNLRETQINTT